MELRWSIVAQAGPLAGQRFVLEEGTSLVVGREKDTDIRIPDANTSRHHAKLQMKGSRVFVEDLGSQSGVHVDGARIEGLTELLMGKKLSVGTQVFVLEIENEEGRASQSIRAALSSALGLLSHPKAAFRSPAILVEAFLFTGIALAVVGRLGIQEAGFFGMFLAAASLHPQFESILARNKRAIFVERKAPTRANTMTAFEILMVFMGMCLAYLVATLSYSAEELSRWFGFVFEMADLKDSHLLNRSFSDFQGIFIHNLTVSLACLLLCVLYRSYAALLILGWNAAVWVVVLVTMTRRVLEQGVTNPLQTSSLAFIAVTPHLVLEAAAYILFAIAAIFYSRGLTRYAIALEVKTPSTTASFNALRQPQETVLQDITIACLKILVLGLSLLALAAFVESTFAPWMIEHIRSQIQR